MKRLLVLSCAVFFLDTLLGSVVFAQQAAYFVADSNNANQFRVGVNSAYEPSCGPPVVVTDTSSVGTMTAAASLAYDDEFAQSVCSALTGRCPYGQNRVVVVSCVDFAA